MLLDDAIAARDAHRVVAFLRGFLNEQRACGARASAYGRASSSGKPVYTRAQIQQLYRAHQKGAFAGREADWQRQEADFIAAGREGHIVGGTDVAGK